MSNTNTNDRSTTKLAPGNNNREDTPGSRKTVPARKKTPDAERAAHSSVPRLPESISEASDAERVWLNLPVRQARQQLEDCKRKLTEFQDELMPYLKMILDQSQYISQLKNDNSSLKEQIEKQTSEIRNQKREIDELRAKVSASESDKAAALTKMKSDYEATLSKTKSESAAALSKAKSESEAALSKAKSDSAAALAEVEQNNRYVVQQNEKKISELNRERKDILTREYPDKIKQSGIFQKTLEPLLSSRIQQKNPSAYMARSILIILSHYHSTGTEVFYPQLLREFSRTIVESQTIAGVSPEEAQKELETWLELFNEIELLKVDDNTWYSIQIPRIGGNVDISSMSYSGNGYTVSKILTWSIFLNGSILYKSEVL